MEIPLRLPILLHKKSFLDLWSRTEWLLILIIVLYIFTAWLLTQLYDRPDVFQGFLYVPVSGQLLFTLVITYTALRILWIMIWLHPYALFKTIFMDFRDTIFNPKCLRQALPLTAMSIVFFGTFSGMKNLIPVINPYSWDEAFATLDKALHAGMQPWQVLQGILGYPLVTSTLNVLYNLWILLLLFIFFWQALTLHLPRIRLQFLLTFFLAWIVLGQLLATIFSSAGPCYYAAVTGTEQGDPYAGLMDYLRQTNEQYPVWALSTQEKLWDAYRDKELRMGSGISAMPSLHVSTAFLFALLGRKRGKPYNFLLTAYCVIIVLGSIHLAWHYAVDAYFAILLTYGLWRFSRFVVHRLEPPEVHGSSSPQA